MSKDVQTAKKVRNKLLANGYQYLRSKGSHEIYGKGKHRAVVTKKLNKMIAERIIKTM